MKSKTKIGLILSFRLDYCRKILHGVRRYAETQSDWHFTHAEPEIAAVRALRRDPPEGLIAFIHTAELARELRRFRLPVVNVCGVLPRLPFPRVGICNEMVGKLAAEHFLDRGLRQFGFVSHPKHGYSAPRRQGFEDAVAAAGCACFRYAGRDALDLNQIGDLWSINARLEAWLASLPKPIGIFAGNDIYGVRVLEACRRAGMRVPDDVAVIGVDNDDLLCGLAHPALSSVSVPLERKGEIAADLLRRLLANAPVPARPILVEPTAVVARQSSDVLALQDRDVADAVAFIRASSHLPLRVDDVVREVAASRRGLERRFRRALRRGIAAEIGRAHLDRARQFLIASDRSMAEIAQLSGFSGNVQFSVNFRREMGCSPSEFRDRHRNRSPDAI